MHRCALLGAPHSVGLDEGAAQRAAAALPLQQVLVRRLYIAAARAVHQGGQALPGEPAGRWLHGRYVLACSGDAERKCGAGMRWLRPAHVQCLGARRKALAPGCCKHMAWHGPCATQTMLVSMGRMLACLACGGSMRCNLHQELFLPSVYGRCCNLGGASLLMVEPLYSWWSLFTSWWSLFTHGVAYSCEAPLPWLGCRPFLPHPTIMIRTRTRPRAGLHAAATAGAYGAAHGRGRARQRRAAAVWPGVAALRGQRPASGCGALHQVHGRRWSLCCAPSRNVCVCACVCMCVLVGGGKHRTQGSGHTQW